MKRIVYHPAIYYKGEWYDSGERPYSVISEERSDEKSCFSLVIVKDFSLRSK
ncbi:MAG: hypothetical protein M0Q23_08750 [Syntrophales bacterium]|nr:hypothetical protein [Syntrophales bacterium]MCK9528708.1 hypothetical protein [Syntrophales bacterium]MDX9922661.1 hypothetical protein [Syntrophales bacterium]